VPTEKQYRLLALVKSEGLMDHWDKRLDEFCDDNGNGPDTFNQCHNAGWLRTWRSDDDSSVMITDVGEGRLAQRVTA
jgi:hypothetical protein